MPLTPSFHQQSIASPIVSPFPYTSPSSWWTASSCPAAFSVAAILLILKPIKIIHTYFQPFTFALLSHLKVHPTFLKAINAAHPIKTKYSLKWPDLVPTRPEGAESSTFYWTLLPSTIDQRLLYLPVASMFEILLSRSKRLLCFFASIKSW